MSRPRKQYVVGKHQRIDKKTGEHKESSNYIIYFNDHLQIKRRLPATTDKSTSEYIANNIIAIVNSKASNQPLAPELRNFIESQPKTLREKLLNWGILDANINSNFEALMVFKKVKRLRSIKTVFEVTGGHLFAWRNHMQACEIKSGYIKEKITSVAKVIDGCGFITPNEINGEKLKNWLADLRKKGSSINVANKYLKNFKSFISWMIKNQRLQQNPVQHLSPLKKVERDYVRRALKPNEINELITATIQADKYHALAGHERSLVYRLAIYTGFRYKEIQTLERLDITFGIEPNITVQSINAKNNKTVTMPLQTELAKDLQQYFTDNPAMPKTKVFPKMWQRGGAKMLRKDLNLAGIEYETDDGIVDFHSLRHTFGTLLANADVHPKTAQDLMRHSDINLTMGRYTHTLREQKAKAIDSMPKIEIRQEQAKTGTMDMPENFSTNFSKNPIKIEQNRVKSSICDANFGKHENALKCTETTVSSNYTTLRPAGV